MFEATLNSELQLRMLREGDAEGLFRLVDANRQHLREWLPWLDANTTPEHSRQFIQSTLRQQAGDQGFVCAIILRGRMVGLVGYHPIRWSNKSVELGYWLSRDAVGQGIMTRCCRVLVDHAFFVLGLNRVAIPVAVGNIRSRAIPERLGFKQEGVTRDAEWLYDHFVDHVLYAMLKKDWNGEPGGALRK
jgi:ribosomal-protein-serine acetyltransferase